MGNNLFGLSFRANSRTLSIFFWFLRDNTLITLFALSLPLVVRWSKNPLLIGQFGPYLAGLIESDGWITVPKKVRNAKGKINYPQIGIVFHITQRPPLRGGRRGAEAFS
jgi:hypothetical protein